MKHVPIKMIEAISNNCLSIHEKETCLKHSEECHECQMGILFEDQLLKAMKEYQPNEFSKDFTSNILKECNEQPKIFRYSVFKPVFYILILIAIQILNFILFQSNFQEVIQSNLFLLNIYSFILNSSEQFKDIISEVFNNLSIFCQLKYLIVILSIFLTYFIFERIFEKKSLKV